MTSFLRRREYLKRACVWSALHERGHGVYLRHHHHFETLLGSVGLSPRTLHLLSIWHIKRKKLMLPMHWMRIDGLPKLNWTKISHSHSWSNTLIYGSNFETLFFMMGCTIQSCGISRQVGTIWWLRHIRHYFRSHRNNKKKMVRKVWAPLKVKLFGWIAIQKRLWTTNRLERRRWPNCRGCPFCKRTS